MSTTPTLLDRALTHDVPAPSRGMTRSLHGPGAVLAACLLGSAAFAADGWSSEADLGLAGVAVMSFALALTSTQAVRASVGRPRRASRLAAVVGAAAGSFVAAFLSAVSVLERTAPRVTDSAPFAVGVAVMSVVLLIVLPLSFIVLGWRVSQDRRLQRWLRGLPWALVLVIAVTAVLVAGTGGSLELRLEAAGVAVVGALLVSLSTGLSRTGSSTSSRTGRRRSGRLVARGTG